jgi:hypothetical protein
MLTGSGNGFGGRSLWLEGVEDFAEYLSPGRRMAGFGSLTTVRHVVTGQPMEEPSSYSL